MGTRNLTCVVQDGKFKVAQYCQWDGYPSGQGKTVLEFLRSLKGEKKKLFLKNLTKCRFIEAKEAEKLLEEKANVKSKDGWINMEESDRIEKALPQLHRNLGAGVLDWITKNKAKDIPLCDQHTFAGDSLFCEWCYVIDLDKGTLEVHGGFNEGTISGENRFAHLARPGEKYAPVKLLKEYDLKKLPKLEQFLKDLKSKDE